MIFAVLERRLIQLLIKWLQFFINNLNCLKRAKFWRFSWHGGLWLENVSIFTAKGTSIPGTTSFTPFCVQIGWEVWPPDRLGKIKKVTNIVYFTYLSRSPRYRHQTWWETGNRFPGRNQLCQILLKSVQRF